MLRKQYGFIAHETGPRKKIKIWDQIRNHSITCFILLFISKQNQMEIMIKYPGFCET